MLLLTASLLVLGTSAAYGCTCAPMPHPQTTFCNDDIVIKGTVLKAIPPKTDDVDEKISYKVKVRKVFKCSLKRGEIITVVTARNSAACGITHLKPDKKKRTYLMTAKENSDGTYRIHACSSHIVPWGLVPKPPTMYNPKKKKSYPGKKFVNCNKCKILFCPNGNCGIVAPPPNTCTYSEDERECVRPVRCEYKGDGKCRWSSASCFGPRDFTSG